MCEVMGVGLSKNELDVVGTALMGGRLSLRMERGGVFSYCIYPLSSQMTITVAVHSQLPFTHRIQVSH